MSKLWVKYYSLTPRLPRCMIGGDSLDYRASAEGIGGHERSRRVHPRPVRPNCGASLFSTQPGSPAAGHQLSRSWDGL